MDRFEEVPDQYEPHALEERIFEYWEAVDAYEQTKAHRSDGEDYFFVDGPPYATGSAHMGTTWNKALKDVYIRYLRMQGYNVYDRPGYDMHGLPIEVSVEQELGFENKKDIREFGVEAFIEECQAFSEEQLRGLQEDFESFGVWMDWEDAYRTVTPEYMEATWWAFKKVHENGLVERGERSISQCPRCETALANNEVEFEDVEDPSIYVKLPLVDRDGSLVVWTTTPWTLPANAFVAVDPEMTYSEVRAFRGGEEEVLYVEESLVEDVLKKGRYDDYEVLEAHAGEEMVGWEYEHPLREEVPDAPDFEGACQVYTADYVEADRTGLVHSAPGHGEEDFERGTELGLEVFCPVGTDGVYDERAGKYAGQYVKDADEAIIEDLERKGLLLSRDTYTHSYGHCWRCETGIIQLVTAQWFITVTDIKDELFENMRDSEWYPGWARDNRFHDFVADAPDWNVSRQRYWGIPLPIWTPEGADPQEEAEDMIVIGTREELAERVDGDVDPETVDLHKGTVDDLTITEGGTTYTRVPDVFDVWLDSSVATWATLDYPARNAEEFERLWPADLIIEAHDQTRGWFWTQLAMSTAALGEVPYEQVLMHGHALDEDGRKMSKSVGNVVAPDEAIERHGRDVMRAFLLSATPQGEDMRFSWEGMEDVQRELNIFWNVFRFPLPYMALDGVDPVELDVADQELEPLDEWVLSRLQAVEERVTDHFEGFRQDKALEALLSFVVEDVSRFYVQVVRERMWEEGTSASKHAAYATVARLLEEVTAMLAPYAPFLAEEVYRTLTGEAGHDTVHMLDWPEPDDGRRRPALEDDVALVRAAEEAGAHARQQAGRKRRWPVRRVVVATESEAVMEALERHGDLLAERLNARAVELVGPGEAWGELAYAAEADMSELGPAFGERASEVMTALNEARVEERSLAALEAAVERRLGEPVELAEEMVEFVRRPPEGVTGAEFDRDGATGVVYVDATLTADIESEGYAREVIRRVQEMRKELDLDLEERIRLEVDVKDDRVADLVREHEDLVAEEVRAAELGAVDEGYRETWDVEGVEVELAIEPLAEATA